MTVGTVSGQPQGRQGGIDYRDDPDAFPAKVTAVLTAAPTGMPEVTSARLGFTEQHQNPDTGAFEDKPDGRSSDGSMRWAVGIDGATYAVGDRLLLRRHSQDADRFEIVQTGGGGSRIPVRPTETRSASEAASGDYKLATVQRRNPTTGVYEDTAEVVRFRPYWAGMRQRVGPVWWCEDTGTRGGTPDRRHVEGIDIPQIARPIPTGYCDEATGTPLTVVVWVNDLLQPDEAG